MAHLRPSWSATNAAGMMPTRLTTAMPANTRPVCIGIKGLGRQTQDNQHLEGKPTQRGGFERKILDGQEGHEDRAAAIGGGKHDSVDQCNGPKVPRAQQLQPGRAGFPMYL